MEVLRLYIQYGPLMVVPSSFILQNTGDKMNMSVKVYLRNISCKVRQDNPKVFAVLASFLCGLSVNLLTDESNTVNKGASQF